MTTNGKASSSTDRARELASFIAEQPDGKPAPPPADEEPEEITAQHLIDAMRAGAAVAVEATGRHRAMQQDQAAAVTKPDNKAPESQPPKAKFALAVLDRIQPPWLRAPVVIVALGLVALLAWRGIALAGLLP
jgi:hypothetical protein